MRTLYVFPHPDDESFGPAPVMHQQLKRGEEVHLLTLTRGGATKQRFRLGVTREEMSQIRYLEMQKVQEVLQLTSMTILDLPDGELHEWLPQQLESIIVEYIDRFKPHVIVSYPVHGISGHHDHLTTHAVVKRIFSDLKGKPQYNYLQRLAFFTLPAPENAEKKGGNSNVQRSRQHFIDCIVPLNKEDRAVLKNALYCYETFIETIEQTGVIDEIGDKVHFEFFGESFEQPVDSLTAGISNHS